MRGLHWSKFKNLSATYQLSFSASALIKSFSPSETPTVSSQTSSAKSAQQKHIAMKLQKPWKVCWSTSVSKAGEKVRLSAFDAHATSLNQIFGTKEVGTCVVLATNINPKYFGGELYLNATAATKFYFDDEMEATRGFLQRDRVELVMDDGTTGSVFVAFDKDMVKLTNIQASQIATEQDDTHPDPGNNSTLPQQILDIVGKKFTFHIKLTSFNFTIHHRSFTVSRIFDKLQDVPKPTFVEKSVHVNLGTKSHASTTGSSSNNNANSTHAPAMKESSNQSTNLWERCHQEHINQCHRQPHPQESEAQLESYSPSPLQITHQRLFTLSISCI